MESVRARLIAARLLMNVVRCCARNFVRTEMYASHADEVMLCCAIFIGQLEQKPMTAAKLASYVGMPRATVVRKLEQLEKRQLVRRIAARRWIITRPIDKAGVENLALLRAACRELSKMDNEAIDGHAQKTVHTTARQKL